VEWLFGVEWSKLLVPDVPLLETFVRGTAVYVFLVAVLRLVLKRQSGAVGITDLIVVVLLADAAQNAMADGYQSIPDGLLLLTVIILWAFALERLAYRFPRLNRLIKPPALPLVEDGRMLRENMRRESITEEELMGHVRLQGIGDLSLVRRAYIESDGRISVLADEPVRPGEPERRAR
jgi:uncharacterized membrane protein YcaP (DUF421 family)